MVWLGVAECETCGTPVKRPKQAGYDINPSQALKSLLLFVNKVSIMEQSLLYIGNDMAVIKAYVITNGTEKEIDEAISIIIERDVAHGYTFHKNPQTGDAAIMFADGIDDFAGRDDFAKVAALVTDRTPQPLDKFRREFYPAPLFALIDLSKK